MNSIRPVLVVAPLIVFCIIEISESSALYLDDYQLDWKTEQLIGRYHNDESKKDETFLIYYRLPSGNVSFSTSGSISHFSGFVFDAETKFLDHLDVKIPRNYPYTNTGAFGEMLVLVNGHENNDYELKMTECFLHYSIPIKGKVEIELAPTTYPASIPFVGEMVPDHCLAETLLLLPHIESEALSESEKIYYYSDGYGLHKIPYTLKYGKITKVGCNQMGLTIDINAEQKDEMVLYVPKTLLDMSGQVNIDISVNSTQTVGGFWDYSREQLEDSLKLTFEVEKGFSPTRIQTSVYGRECKIAPMENTYYNLSSPKIQLENGILPQKIICREDRTLILKTSNHSPVCVKQETKKILADRNYYEERVWIMLELDCDAGGCILPSWIYPQGDNKSPLEYFMVYFNSKDIEILDAKTNLISTNDSHCEWGECGESSIEFYFQIFEKDVERVTQIGFEQISDEEIKQE